MTNSIRHIALVVPDLRTAEAYYQYIFDMELIGREAPGQGGLWYTLPFDKNWDDAQEAGINLAMSALRKGEFVLALFEGQGVIGQVFAIGLTMPIAEIAAVRSRLTRDTLIVQDESERLIFRDLFHINWQLSPPGDEFQTAGVFSDRWLDL